MLAVSERITGLNGEPDQTIWHKPGPGHRCTGECDFHPIACSEEEGIAFPGPKQNVPIRLDRENERWCEGCLNLAMIQPGQIYRSADPRDTHREPIRITAYDGTNRADVVDAYSGKKPRSILINSLHVSPTTKNGTPRRTGYVLEDT
ncbi:hypothetical protein ABZW50_08790 [Streptomyces bacillaris]